MNRLKQIAFLLLLCVVCTSCGNRNHDGYEGKHTDSLHAHISISGAFALYPMAVKWANDYHKLYPHVTIDVQAGGSGKGVTDALSRMVDIGMVSRSIKAEEIAKGAFPVAVAKDAVIPTLNSGNPYIAQINRSGMTVKQFRKIWVEGSVKTWNDVLKNNSQKRVKIFTRSDAAGAPETWANFLGSKQEDLLGIGVFGDPGLAEIISSDEYAIGFNNICYVYDLSSGKPFDGIQPVPIDFNGNDTLDEAEKFYDSLWHLNKAIADGRFTSPPARNLYFVFNGKPKNKAVIKFMKWILADGQRCVDSCGFVRLDMNQLLLESEKLK